MKHNTLYHNLKLARPGAKALSLALVLLMLAAVASAQTPKPSPQAGQILSERPDSRPSGDQPIPAGDKWAIRLDPRLVGERPEWTTGMALPTVDM
jgi:hypothetical protein